MGCCRVVNWQRLVCKYTHSRVDTSCAIDDFDLQLPSGSPTPDHIRCPEREDTVHLRRCQRSVYRCGMGIVSRGGSCRTCTRCLKATADHTPRVCQTNQRTLEEMNLVFASDSIWNWEAEKNYRRLVEENPDLVQAARRGSAAVDPETGLPKPGRRASAGGDEKYDRKSSLVSGQGCHVRFFSSIWIHTLNIYNSYSK